MNGLYQRALRIYKKRAVLTLTPKGDEDSGLQDIPVAERESILREIDHMLASSRVKDEDAKVHSGKSGFTLPLVVNICVLFVVALVVVFFTQNQNLKEQGYVSGIIALQGAESQVVLALKQEAAAQLGQKDQDILAFQRRLEEAAAERERIRQEADQAVLEREQQLAQELSAALAAERVRLQNTGVDPEALELELKAYEQRMAADTARQLDALRSEAASEAAAREAAVDELITEYERNLSLAQSERVLLQQQYQSKEADLRTQYSRETAVLQEEKALAVSDLERLREQKSQEDMVMNRILSDYDKINTFIRAGANEDALKSISALRKALDEEPAVSLTVVQTRKPVELFILSSLDELIRNRIERDRIDTAALLELKVRIETMKDKILRAETEYRSGNQDGAKKLYLSALADFPEARIGHERLEAMMVAANTQELSSLTSQIDSLKTELEALESDQAGLAAVPELEHKKALEAQAREYSALMEERAREYREALELKDMDREAALEAQAQTYITRLEEQAQTWKEEAQTQRAVFLLSQENLVAEGASLIGKGAWEATLDRYRVALGLLLDNPMVASTIVDQLAEAGYRIGVSGSVPSESGGVALESTEPLGHKTPSEGKVSLSERIAQVRGELASLPVTGITPEQDDYASLLQAKLLIWQIVGSEPVKSQYPELYGMTERYFDSFALQQHEEGRSAALKDMIALTEALRGGESPAVVAARIVPANDRDAAVKLLDSLEALVRGN